MYLFLYGCWFRSAVSFWLRIDLQGALNTFVQKLFGKKEDVLTVTFDLENTGKYEGTEVAQLYVQDKFASVTRPVKELKRFARVTLKPGEKKNVSFELPISELAFWNIDMVKTVEAGDFALWVAPDSQSGEEVFFKVVD